MAPLKTPPPSPASTALGGRFAAFDLLATLVAVVGRDGVVLFANAALEDVLGLSRRLLRGACLPDNLTE
ncbi:MAG: PAS domain-containing sensor histidine kinase, partial [Betaproteobacteria bacterium]|nr:PAS domain-containing sensor histidine kinase [Betaproteobacteria bacterium]